MDPKICPNCKKEIPAGAELCESCGAARQPENRDVQQKRLSADIAKAGIWMAIAAVFCAVMGLLCAVMGLLIAWVDHASFLADPAWQIPIGVFGMLFFFMVPFLASTGAIVGFLLIIWFSIKKRKVESNRAAVGFMLNVIILLLIAIILPSLTSRGNPGSLCLHSNIRNIGLVLDMYAEDNQGRFPPIDEIKNNFVFDGNLIYPKYLTDISSLGCPDDPGYNPLKSFRLAFTNFHPGASIGEAAHPDCITDESYCYLGWVVTSDEEAEVFFQAYDKLSPEDYDKDLLVPEGKGNGGGHIIRRLTKGAEQFLNSPAIDSSVVPIVWDNPRDMNHGTIGVVLYLDHHREYVPFGKFPMTKTMARLLDERPREPIPDCE